MEIKYKYSLMTIAHMTLQVNVAKNKTKRPNLF